MTRQDRAEVPGAPVGPPAGLAPGVHGRDSAHVLESVGSARCMHDATQALVLEHIKDEGMARELARLSTSLGLRQQTLDNGSVAHSCSGAAWRTGGPSLILTLALALALALTQP